MKWQAVRVFGVLVCFLSGTVAESFARQTNASPHATPAKKGEQKGAKSSLVGSSKKQSASSLRRTPLTKKNEKKTQEVRRETRTKKVAVRSDHRLIKVKSEKPTASRLQRRRPIIRFAKRIRPASVKMVRHSEPVVGKDYESVILADAESGHIILAQDIDKQWPAASLTKMMVGLLALEDISAERFSLHTPVVISERATRARGRTIGLREGEEFPLGELLQLMLVTSANDASVAVAERIRGSVEACVTAMNQQAQSLGMGRTEFQTVNGMPLSNGRAGDFSSARDLVTLARVLLQHELVLEWTSHNQVPFRDGLQMLPNTNRLVGRVDGVTGLKTGFTSRARYNLVATAQRGSLSLIAVVLGGRNSHIRFKTAAEYLEWGFTNYKDQSVFSGEEKWHGHFVPSFQAVHSTALP